MEVTGGEVTLLFRKIRAGERGADSRLGELIYAELRRLASIRMRSERGDHTLSPTALANEAWIRLVPEVIEKDLENRQHFFAIAATAMRRILVDHARARSAAKRGGTPLRLDTIVLGAAVPAVDEKLLALDEALDRLAAVKPRVARVVVLRFFGGLTHQQIGSILKEERRTVDRDWAIARAWLLRELSRAGS